MLTMTNLMFEHDRIAAPDDAPRVHIIPFGLEDTVSYEGGTAKAPENSYTLEVHAAAFALPAHIRKSLE
jgi:hypothetical protein